MGLYWASANHVLPWSCGGLIAESPPYPRPNMGNLTQRSEIILMGGVQTIGPTWTSSIGTLVTKIDILVSEYVKPSHLNSPTHSLIAAGRTLGCYIEEYGGEPRFAAREEVIVFLVSTPDGQGRVNLGSQGKLTITDGMVRRPIDGTLVPLTDILDEIRRNL